MERKQRRPKLPFGLEEGTPRVRVTLSPSGPVAHRPGEVILAVDRVPGADGNANKAVDIVADRTKARLVADDTDFARARRTGHVRVRLDGRQDVLAYAREVNQVFDDRVATPNGVFLIGNFTADPMTFASGVTADPMTFASAFGADPMTFANSSTARPAAAPGSGVSKSQPAGPGVPIVAILDTGVPAGGLPAPGPGELDFVSGFGNPLREAADRNSDAFLDIAAGHSTFIRTIIQRASPAAQIMCEGVIHNDGDGDETDISDALERVFDTVGDKSKLLVNLSFSAYYDDDLEPPLIAFWIRELVAAGAVVVAAAGNNGECRKKFPAAMPEVLSVGSVGACGPSSFSNHGPWVDASAPGEDLISEFFNPFDGAFEPVITGAVPDLDEFAGWAMWSGTSFATPTVLGALAELIERYDCSAQAAVRTLVGRPGLYRMPDYGVIVNRVF